MSLPEVRGVRVVFGVAGVAWEVAGVVSAGSGRVRVTVQDTRRVIRKMGLVLVCDCKREGNVTDIDGTSWRTIHDDLCPLNDDPIDFTPPRKFTVFDERGRSAVYVQGRPGHPAKRITRWVAA